MKLEFSNGLFCLTVPKGMKVPKGWTHHSLDLYISKDLKAIAKQSWCADKATKELIYQRIKIIKRAPAPWAFPPGKTPLPYQPRCIDHALSRNRSLINAAPGAGKCAITYTCIDADPGKTLIICPPYLLDTWVHEQYPVWCKSKASIAVLEGGYDRKIVESNDIIVVPDSQAALILPFLKKYKWHWVFVDESHRYNNGETGRGKALWGSARQRKNRWPLVWSAKNFVLLTGTPKPNRAMELWPMLSVCAPQAIGYMDKMAYGMRYCGAMKNDYGHYNFDGHSNFEELVERMSKDFMVVVSPEEVKKHLPPLVEEIYYLGVPERRQKDKIRTLEETIKAKYPTTEDLLIGATSGDPAISELRELVGTAKVTLAAEAIAELRLQHPKEKFLIFTHSRKVTEVLCKKIKGALRVDGSVGNRKKKQKIIDQFRTDKKCLNLVGNIDSMGLGYTITEASVVVFVEFSWVDDTNTQARDRAHRNGQKKKVLSYTLVLRNTLDEYMYKKNLNKRRINQAFYTEGK